jgi:hypothetical protein
MPAWLHREIGQALADVVELDPGLGVEACEPGRPARVFLPVVGTARDAGCVRQLDAVPDATTMLGIGSKRRSAATDRGPSQSAHTSDA